MGAHNEVDKAYTTRQNRGYRRGDVAIGGQHFSHVAIRFCLGSQVHLQFYLSTVSWIRFRCCLVDFLMAWMSSDVAGLIINVSRSPS
jgi:hypothetical protein